MNKVHCFLVLAGLFIAGRASATTNLYFTRFEPSEGYDRRYELVGQKGWVTDTASYGGNGLLTNYQGSQAAYVGLFPLDPPTDHISVWQPLNYSPMAKGTPLVNFSITMTMVDSTTTNWDDFFFSVYNRQGQCLFTVDFYNVNLGIYYALDGTNQWVDTGASFTHETVYTLGISMDFLRNRWSSTLNGSVLITNQPMTTTNATLDLGDIDAVWVPTDINVPGDNFMIFDNYKVTADPLPPARLTALGYTSNRQFLLRLTGPSGARYAIEATPDFAHWSALKTNTVTDGTFDFIDTGASGFARRSYRARLVP